MRLVPAPGGGYVITGGTRSGDFPVSLDAYDTTHNGNDDAFVATMSADGSTLGWSTFLGGVNADRGLALAVDPDANVTVAGYTLSPDLPVTLGAFDLTANGSYDVFVHQLSADGRRLRLGTYLGGALRDETYAAKFLDDGRLLLVGVTESEGFPVTAGAYQEGYAGLADAFVAELDLTRLAGGRQAPPAATGLRGVGLSQSVQPARGDRLRAGHARHGPRDGARPAGTARARLDGAGPGRRGARDLGRPGYGGTACGGRRLCVPDRPGRRRGAGQARAGAVACRMDPAPSRVAPSPLAQGAVRRVLFAGKAQPTRQRLRCRGGCGGPRPGRRHPCRSSCCIRRKNTPAAVATTSTPASTSTDCHPGTGSRCRAWLSKSWMNPRTSTVSVAGQCTRL